MYLKYLGNELALYRRSREDISAQIPYISNFEAWGALVLREIIDLYRNGLNIPEIWKVCWGRMGRSGLQRAVHINKRSPMLRTVGE